VGEDAGAIGLAPGTDVVLVGVVVVVTGTVVVVIGTVEVVVLEVVLVVVGVVVVVVTLGNVVVVVLTVVGTVTVVGIVADVGGVVVGVVVVVGAVVVVPVVGGGTVVGGRVVDGPVVDGPVVDGPVVGGTVVGGTVVGGTVVVGTVLDGPVLEGPVLEGPVLEGPVLEGAVDGGTLLGAVVVGGTVVNTVVGLVLGGGAVVGGSVVSAAVVGVPVVGAPVVGAPVAVVRVDGWVVARVVGGDVVGVAAVLVVFVGFVGAVEVAVEVVVPAVVHGVPIPLVRVQFGFVVLGGLVVGVSVVLVAHPTWWARPSEQVVVVLVTERRVFGCVVGFDSDGRTGTVAEVLAGSPRYTQDTTTVGAGQPPGQVKMAGNGGVPVGAVPVGAVLAEQPFFWDAVAETRQSVPAGSPLPSYWTCSTRLEQSPTQARPAVTVNLYDCGAPIENGAVSTGDGTPKGSGTTVLSSLSETEQVPPIWSRSRLVLTWSPATGSLKGRISDPHVIAPLALKEPAGRAGKVATTRPVLASAPTTPVATMCSPGGHVTVFENGRPVTVTAAAGCPAGVTTTLGT
jgi:hypothetical protein